MKIWLIITAMCVIAVVASAQEPSVRTVQANTVSVNAQGEYQAEPDTAVIRFTVSAAEKNAKAAYDRAAREVEQVREALRSVGVDPSAARFGYFSLSPTYDYKNPKRKIVQFVVSTTVELRLKQFDKVGPLLDQLSNMEITGDQTLQYIVENTESAKAKAVQNGMSRARAEAEAIAKAGNRTLGELVWASVDTFERIRPLYAGSTESVAGRAMMAAPAPSEGFTPGAMTITARVDALFALQ